VCLAIINVPRDRGRLDGPGREVNVEQFACTRHGCPLDVAMEEDPGKLGIGV